VALKIFTANDQKTGAREGLGTRLVRTTTVCDVTMMYCKKWCSVFAYCKRSRAGGEEGLGAGLVLTL